MAKTLEKYRRKMRRHKKTKTRKRHLKKTGKYRVRKASKRHSRKKYGGAPTRSVDDHAQLDDPNLFRVRDDLSEVILRKKPTPDNSELSNTIVKGGEVVQKLQGGETYNIPSIFVCVKLGTFSVGNNTIGYLKREYLEIEGNQARTLYSVIPRRYATERNDYIRNHSDSSVKIPPGTILNIKEDDPANKEHNGTITYARILKKKWSDGKKFIEIGYIKEEYLIPHTPIADQHAIEEYRLPAEHRR